VWSSARALIGQRQPLIDSTSLRHHLLPRHVTLSIFPPHPQQQQQQQQLTIAAHYIHALPQSRFYFLC